jgi:hypothetical protein
VPRTLARPVQQVLNAPLLQPKNPPSANLEHIRMPGIVHHVPIVRRGHSTLYVGSANCLRRDYRRSMVLVAVALAVRASTPTPLEQPLVPLVPVAKVHPPVPRPSRSVPRATLMAFGLVTKP